MNRSRLLHPLVACAALLSACAASQPAPTAPCASPPVAATIPSTAAAASPVAACASPEQRGFDFWVGDWDLVVRGRTAVDAPWAEAKGSNHVTSTLGGCVVEERFEAVGPGQPWAGHSVSQWVPAEKQWRQTWVDDSGGYLPFRGGMVNGEMVLMGEPKPNGHVMRMVFGEITHAHMVWRWESSTDGKAWTPMMTIDYRRKA